MSESHQLSQKFESKHYRNQSVLWFLSGHGRAKSRLHTRNRHRCISIVLILEDFRSTIEVGRLLQSEQQASSHAPCKEQI